VIDEQKSTADEAEETAAEGAVTASTESGSAEAAPPQEAAPAESDAALSQGVDSQDDDDIAPRFQVEEEDEEVAEWADDDDDVEEAVEEDLGDVEDVAPLEEVSDDDDEPAAEDLEMDWYILKVQSNREDSIAAALQRRVSVAGFDKFFDEIVVPVEMVTEFKAGKRRVVRRKLYPGYIVVHMAINDETWFLVRETPGIGDFTGSAGRPTPMLAQEVSRIIKKDEDVVSDEPKLQIGFRLGDQVKINEGTFENFEGEVEAVDTTSGRVTVMINIFGRSTPVELEHWQIEAV